MREPIDKPSIRQLMRERRRSFFASRHGQPGGWSSERFDALLSRGSTIASYHAYGSEADPTPIVALALRREALVAWPRVDVDGVMRFYSLGPSRSLEPDASGMMAPGADAVPASPDIILLPLIAFDRSGTRLGQGGGHYDRAIAALDAGRKGDLPRATRIGIAWSMQEFPSLPRDPWDMTLDHIITEQEWITP